MTDAYSKDLTENLLVVVESVQQQSITWLVAELMALLLEHGYSFRHLVEAVADYADSHPEFEPALGHLEEASEVLKKILLTTNSKLLVRRKV